MGGPDHSQGDHPEGSSHAHSHSGSHVHAHSHGGIARTNGLDRRLAISVALNLIITAAQVVGGLVSGSLSLLSDALHNFSDASSLIVSLIANKLSRRKATDRMTFGFRRAEIVGAFVNLITLGIVTILIVKEAIHRLLNPQPVDTLILLAVATVGLAANLLTALLLHRDSEHSVNIRSAYIHIVMDTLSSVAVIVGGIIIYYSDWTWVDPILSVLIAAYIVYFGWKTLKSVTEILMEAVPPEIDIADVEKRMQAVQGVSDAHHLHVWMIDEQSVALEAHVRVKAGDWSQMESVKREIKEMLGCDFGIRHSTLEFEFEDVPCPDEAEHDCY